MWTPTGNARRYGLKIPVLLLDGTLVCQTNGSMTAD